MRLLVGVAAVVLCAGSLAGVGAQQRTNTTLGIKPIVESLNATTRAEADKSCYPDAPLAESDRQSIAKQSRLGGVDNSPAFILKKTGLSNTCSGGNVEFDGEDGIVLNRLGFDLRADSYCQAGAPRFLIKIEGSPDYLPVTCAEMTVVSTFSDSEGRKWKRLRVPQAAKGGALNGEELGDLFIAFDETGRAVIDNIAISNATLKATDPAGKRGNR